MNEMKHPETLRLKVVRPRIADALLRRAARAHDPVCPITRAALPA